MEYTINVAQTASYRIDVRAASEFTTSTYHVEIDGVNVTGTLTQPNTGGWNTFQNTGKGGITLTQGTHILRLYSDMQYSDIDSIIITKEQVPPPTLSFSIVNSAFSWSSANAASCTASGGWTGTKALSGNEPVGTISSTTSFTLSCTGQGGTTAKTITIQVQR